MGTRADNRDGSCRPVLSGRHTGQWRVQYGIADDLGRTKRLSRLFDKKAEAKTFLQGLRQGTKVEAARAKKELTLAGWFDWLAEHDWPEELDEKTVAIRVGRFNKHVRPILGGVPLTKLDPLVVRAYYRELKANGVGDATIHGVKANLVRVFNQAISPYRRVPATMDNPFRLTLQSLPARDAVALTPDEARKAFLCDKLSTEERAMLGVYLLAGLRLSEQMALTREQLLLDQDLIYVDRAVKLDKRGGQEIGLPKGDKKRLAVMCPSLKALLLPLTNGIARDALLWPSEAVNKPKMKKNTYDAWKRIVKACELPESMSPHDCRLTHINWIEKLMPDVSITSLKEHVGHAGEGVTQINYTRPLTTAQAILRTGLESVAGSILAAPYSGE